MPALKEHFKSLQFFVSANGELEAKMAGLARFYCITYDDNTGEYDFSFIFFHPNTCGVNKKVHIFAESLANKQGWP